jgi:peroxiredoxin Q/BCP
MPPAAPAGGYTEPFQGTVFSGGRLMRAALLTAGLITALGMGVMAQNAELKVGDPAPNFKLQATDGQTYQLSDFKGKKAVVVAWFPKAFTQGCTIECKSLAENGDKIRKYNVAYFMASVDPLEDNIRFAKATSVKLSETNTVEKKEADFPMLSDPTKATAKAYGVLTERGLANRWTFYIDKDGRISYIDKAVKPATSAEDMLEKINELKVGRAQ